MQRSRTPIIAAALGIVLFCLAGCGCGTCGEAYVYEEVWVEGPPPPPPIGAVGLDNFSPEFVGTFFLAPAATDLWSPELLGAPLPPGASAYVGDFDATVYDAEADLEFGDLVQWFDVPVPADTLTSFEVY